MLSLNVAHCCSSIEKRRECVVALERDSQGETRSLYGSHESDPCPSFTVVVEVVSGNGRGIEGWGGGGDIAAMCVSMLALHEAKVCDCGGDYCSISLHTL